MKTMNLYPLELGRLLRSRLTWLVILLTVISPVVGLFLYQPATASTMLTTWASRGIRFWTTLPRGCMEVHPALAGREYQKGSCHPLR